MDLVEQANNHVFRENNFVDSIIFMTFRWAMRNLFQRHQIIFIVHLCFRIILADKQVQSHELEEFFVFLRYPRSSLMPNPVPE
jgi:hypothetical protein